MATKMRERRRWMHGYAEDLGLGIPDGFTVESDEPFQAVAREFLLRIEKNLEARKDVEFPAKYVDGTWNTGIDRIAFPVLSMNEKAVEALLGEIGVREIPWGSNRSPRIHEYQAVTGAYNTYWCASFFWWGWRQGDYTGRVSAGAWDSTDHIGRRITIAQAIPGAGVSFNVGKGHIGAYLDHSRTRVKTIDGNTRDQVAIRERARSSIHSISIPHN
jgi:hypothetical protein